jgi:hypothetical protein
VDGDYVERILYQGAKPFLAILFSVIRAQQTGNAFEKTRSQKIQPPKEESAPPSAMPMPPVPISGSPLTISLAAEFYNPVSH